MPLYKYLYGSQKIYALAQNRAAPALAFAPVPALLPFLLSQFAGCLSAESTGVQARKRGDKGAVTALAVIRQLTAGRIQFL